MNEEISFEVGGKYENMKGVFEVIAIHRDSMDIRWESGEEISTPIALQQRIIERMQHEKEMEEQQLLQKAKKAKASASKGGKLFTGLDARDFGLAVSKTTWRGRGQLGGAVAKQLTAEAFKFNSWAVLRKPEVHWLDVKRKKQEDWPLQVKFYARVDDGGIYFGLHVPKPDPSLTEAGDWQALMNWLAKPENEAWLKKQCGAHGLYLCDFSAKGFGGTLEVRDDQWVHCQADDKATKIEALGAFLSAAVETGEIDLRVEKRVEKDSAVERKQKIAGDLAALFNSLMPLYAAGTTR
jgi:hypothetical protein